MFPVKNTRECYSTCHVGQYLKNVFFFHYFMIAWWNQLPSPNDTGWYEYFVCQMIGTNKWAVSYSKRRCPIHGGTSKSSRLVHSPALSENRAFPTIWWLITRSRYFPQTRLPYCNWIHFSPFSDTHICGCLIIGSWFAPNKIWVFPQ